MEVVEVYTTYIWRLKPFILRLDSSISSTLVSTLGGPRGLWIKPFHRQESVQKLSVFFVN